jgi:HEAT repeat protein
METLARIIESLPLWVILLFFAFFVAVIADMIWSIKAKKRIYNILARAADNPDKASDIVAPIFKKRYAFIRSQAIERFVKDEGNDIIYMTGIDRYWIQNLLRLKRKRDFNRIMHYAPDTGLFTCFLLSLEKKRFARLLISYLEESEDFLYMRRVALSGQGEEFDGARAREMFLDHIDEIREMTGDPEWASRYFAIKILLHDDDNRSIRALWDAFEDSYPLVRKTVAHEFTTDQTDRLLDRLSTLTINDYTYEVRHIAWNRIMNEFPDYRFPDTKKMSQTQSFHVLELLRPGIKEDENLAFYFLDQSNLELRLPAARYLKENAALDRLCLDVDLGDKKLLERNLALLEKAARVNVTDFLGCIEKTDNPASLLVCARILLQSGSRHFITTLARKSFSLYDGTSRYKEIYSATLDCVEARGNDDALKLMDRELQKRRSDVETLPVLLEHVPPHADHIIQDTLIGFLKDDKIRPRDLLRQALVKMSPPHVLEQVLKILYAGRDAHPHLVRKDALKLLGQMDLHYCLQLLLENLPSLPVDEASEFTRILSSYPKKEFNSRVGELLDSGDARIRASVITALPVTGDRSFVKRITKSLNDADPDVRIASVWALVNFEEYKSLQQTVDMLRDPVKRVRQEVASAVGLHGSVKMIKELKQILHDDNEVESVKYAAITGLGASKLKESIDILIEKLEKTDKDEESKQLGLALSSKTETKDARHLVEHFKDADPSMREKITRIFIRMEEKGEKMLTDLLREDIKSLNPYIAEILDATGYVESIIRSLSHRDPAVRRDSADTLSRIGTKSAFRGIVLAARDPDEEVRVKVIRALEKLETKEGKKMLDELEKDPDRKVRKYTHWALERLRSKSL